MADTNWTPTAHKLPHTEVSGISAVNKDGHTEWYSIWAKHSERDSLNRPITSTYVPSAEYIETINHINQQITKVNDTLSSEIVAVNTRLETFSGATEEAIQNINNMLTGDGGLSSQITSISSHIHNDLTYSGELDPFKGISSYNSIEGKLTYGLCEINASLDDIINNIQW